MSQFKSGLKIKINDGKEFLPDVLKLTGNGLTLDPETGSVNIDLKNPTISIPTASKLVNGVVKIGSGLNIGVDGTLSIPESRYEGSTRLKFGSVGTAPRAAALSGKYVAHSYGDNKLWYNRYDNNTSGRVDADTKHEFPLGWNIVDLVAISESLFIVLMDGVGPDYRKVFNADTGTVINVNPPVYSDYFTNATTEFSTQLFALYDTIYYVSYVTDNTTNLSKVFLHKMTQSGWKLVLLSEGVGSGQVQYSVKQCGPGILIFAAREQYNTNDYIITYEINSVFHSDENDPNEYVRVGTKLTTGNLVGIQSSREILINESGTTNVYSYADNGIPVKTFESSVLDKFYHDGNLRHYIDVKNKMSGGLVTGTALSAALKNLTIASSDTYGVIKLGNSLSLINGAVEVIDAEWESDREFFHPGMFTNDVYQKILQTASGGSSGTTITLESVYDIPTPNLVPYGVDKSGFAVPVTASYKEKYSVLGITGPGSSSRETDIYQSITDDIYFSQYLIPLTQPLSIINDGEVFGYSTLAEVGLLPTTQLTDIRNNVSQYSTVIIGVDSYIDIIRETSPLIDIGVNTIVGEEGLFINHNLPTAGTVVSVAKISESGKISKAILSEYQHTVTTGDGDVVTIYYPTQVDTVDPTIVTVVKVFNPDFGATTHLINHTNNKDLAAQQPIPNVELITSGVLKLSSSDVNNVRAIIPNLSVGDILYVDTNSYGLTNVPGEISQPVGTFLGNSILVNIQRGIATPVGDEPIKPAIGNSGNTYVPDGLVFDTPIDNGEGSEGGGE